ncbi:MAG: ATP-binding cassette domain-containing protein [Propionibacteriaceae bacterium]|nr:ATP-binding cassette domain-containing protein [Propionibacteriaceae bacterium]
MGTRHVARLRSVTAGYQHRSPVLHDVDLDIPFGRQLAVLGPSGAGKSTLVRVLTGELRPTSGTVTHDGGSPHTAVVNQQPWLYPWLSVRENIALGLRFTANTSARPGDIDGIVALLGLSAVVDSYPDQLSGGQAQRTSLARALAVQPDWLLLDEPFSALDPATRSDLQTWLRTTVTASGLTSVIVTHDIDEALLLADDIVLVDTTGRLSHRWTNDVPATSAASAQLHPLRSRIRAAYEPLDATLEPGDEEFSGYAVTGVRRG